MKKIILLNGSPRTHGNTYQSLEMIQNIFKENEIDSEIIQLGSMNIFGCKACNGCYKNKNNKCSIDNDGLNEVINKVFNADGLIIGSPTYYSNVTGNVKNFIDRCGYVNNANGNYLKGKPGAPIVSVRRSGGNFTYAAINFFFGINEMPIITSSYWNMTLSLKQGDVQKDEEGKQTFVNLANNFVDFLRKMVLSKNT